MNKRIQSYTLILFYLLILCACSENENNSQAAETVYTLISSEGTSGGTISPARINVSQGETTSFTITPDSEFNIDNVTGCDGSLSGNTYTTSIINADCTVIVNFSKIVVQSALTFVATKTFRFNWTDVLNATHYKILENPDGNSGFTQVGSNILQGTQTFDHIIPLYARINAQYIIQNCDVTSCTDFIHVSVSNTLAASIGYIKASNTSENDEFGYISLSNDGNTLAIGAAGEDSLATGINGDENDNLAINSGAVYLFTRSGSLWSQQAYIKASNTEAYDDFGSSVSLSEDGNTLAVGAPGEASNATGVDGDSTDNSAFFSGAVYIFIRNETRWTQQAYVKASNTETEDRFGKSITLSGDGNTLAVGASGEDSHATGIDGNENDNSKISSGAVYLFTRVTVNWSQQAYIKANNTDAFDDFSFTLSLSKDGNTLAVGAPKEDSNATDVNGDENDNSASSAGAAYLFNRTNNNWSQNAYIKASNTETFDKFGYTISLSGDGNTLAVGAFGEDSNATGINGDEADNSASSSGAVYLLTRAGGNWSQQAYVKASNAEKNDKFSRAIALSGDGNSLAISALEEDSSATGINGNESDNSKNNSGAVYLLTRSGSDWTQQAYIKASNTGEGNYGDAISLSEDGNTLAVGDTKEDSNVTGVNGNQNDDSMIGAGAVYLY